MNMSFYKQVILKKVFDKKLIDDLNKNNLKSQEPETEKKSYSLALFLNNVYNLKISMLKTNWIFSIILMLKWNWTSFLKD